VPDAPTYALRHLRFGWWSLLVFATLGLILESLHGFKVRAYLDVSNETRRLMWTLAHAHGTLLAVVSGAAHLGTTHRLLAALVAPPLAALLISAWLAHRELVPAVLASSALFTATGQGNEAMVAKIPESKVVVILGGSFIGYELTEAFAFRKLETHWLMRGPWFLRRALDEAGGKIVSLLAQDAGVHLLINSDYRNDIETHELFASDVIPHFA